MDVVIGQVVYSKAGRDKGKCFIITGIINESYVLISDGDLRRYENSKKKKTKHLVITENIIDALALRITAGGKVTNADIRKALLDVKLSLEANE